MCVCVCVVARPIRRFNSLPSKNFVNYIQGRMKRLESKNERHNCVLGLPCLVGDHLKKKRRRATVLLADLIETPLPQSDSAAT